MNNINKPFAIADVYPGVLNALVKKIMRQTGVNDANEAVRLVTSGEWLVKKPKREWREADGVIYLEVTSSNPGCEGWSEWCRKRSIGVHAEARDILSSLESQVTQDIEYKVAIIKRQRSVTIGQVRTVANFCPWTPPPVEMACLIREKFSDWEIKAMGLSLINIMHKPIVSGGIPLILSVYSNNEYENYIWSQPVPNDTDPVELDVGYAYLISATPVE